MRNSRKIVILILFILSVIQLRGYTHELKRIVDAGKGVVVSVKEELEVEKLNTEDPEYKEKLMEIQDELNRKQISQLNKILNNKYDYPENILELVFINPETIDFVSDFLNRDEYLNMDIDKKESVPLNRDIPLYLQWDKRWGYRDYGSSIIALSGCAPTSLSMVVSGLNRDVQATPDVIANISAEKGFITEGNFSSWELMTQGAKEFGILSKEIPLDEEMMKNEISKGNPLILSMKPGQFTTVGHMIVLIGVDENGEFIINDANSVKRSNQTWKFEELKDDIRNIWSYSLE